MKFLLKYEDTKADAWSVSLEHLNKDKKDFTKDYSPAIYQFVDFNGKQSIFKDNGVLKIGFRVNIANQTVSVKELSLDTMAKLLKTHKNIMFAYNNVDNDPNKSKATEIISNSNYYVRDYDTGAILDHLGNPVTKLGPFSIWFTVIQLTDEIAYMVINPNLLAVNTSIDGNYNGHTLITFDSETGPIQEAILAPRLIRGAKALPDKLYVRDRTFNDIEIDLLGNSIFTNFGYDLNLPKPTFTYEVDTSCDYSMNGSVITLMPIKVVEYVSVRIITDTYLDIGRRSESLTCTFLIV